MRCLDLILSNKKWGSVRKIRFKSQIASLIKFASVHDGSHLMDSDIKQIIEENRAQRETIRMQITQTGWRRALEQYGDQYSKTYSPLVQDTIAFAKGTSIFSILNGQIKCSEESKIFSKRLSEKLEELDKILLPLVLDSKYKAYVCFLANLQRLGGILSIPQRYRKRTVASGMREFLNSEGFATDIASFFTIRDLLYDFGLVNWRIMPTDSIEEIYLAGQLVDKGTKPEMSYLDKVHLDQCDLFYNKRITSTTFIDTLEKHYLSLSGNDFGVIVDLLELRDLVCQELRLSDTQFNRKLLEVYKDKRIPLDIELSQGRISPRRSSGLLIKAVNVIEIDKAVFATYIRLRRRNQQYAN